MDRRMRTPAMVFVGFVVALPVVGFTYQFIANRADAYRAPEAGRLVDVGGYRLKVNCIGTGSPTVVLESGLGDMSVEWTRVQPEIAKFTRVCSYDRAGYGGSDAGPLPRTSAQIARELHTLLRNVGEEPPYLLVGHSFGGYNVRVFNGTYPTEAIGIVLVDATQEDQYRLLPAAWTHIYNTEQQRVKKQARWAPVFIDMGVARIWLRWRRGLDSNSYLILQSKWVKARASEFEHIRESAEQARASDSISGKSLIVLSGGKNSDETLSNGLSRQDFDDFHKIWISDLQVRLARLSTRGKQVIVEDSGHDIPSESPDSIVRAVRDMVNDYRETIRNPKP